MGYSTDRHDDIDANLQFYNVPSHVGEEMAQVRGKIQNLLHDLVDLVPPGRDWAMGFSHMEEAQRCFIAGMAKQCEPAPTVGAKSQLGGE